MMSMDLEPGDERRKDLVDSDLLSLKRRWRIAKSHKDLLSADQLNGYINMES